MRRTANPNDTFVSEPVTPAPGTMDAAGTARGEPGLPGRFVWRGREYTVVDVLDRWKETGRCTSGSPERYVRKHWFRVRIAGGNEMTLYFQRQPRSRRERTRRWWLYTVSGNRS